MTTYKIAVSSMTLDGKIPAGDERWRDFNASFRNLDVLKSDIAGMINDGHAFTTWHRNQWRNAANYELGQHLALDFDAGNETSSIPVLMRDKFIQQYGTYVYSTPSHTPEAPKSRVLFCLDTPIMQAKNYVLASRAMLWLFGTADAKCKDAARFFYGSVNCEAVFVNRVLPLAKVREIIGQYMATGQEERRRHTAETPAEQQTFDGDADKLVRYWQRRMEGAREGERNDTLNKAAYSLGELVRNGVISRHEVYDILEPAALRIGLHKSEVASTIRSGLSKWAA